jgi:thymidylate kinase
MDTKKLRTYAFEGINAGGKSSVINILHNQFLDKKYKLNVYKISGLGTGPRMNRLKEILEYRETLLRKGKLNDTQKEDYLKDRLFRIATRQQIRIYKKSNPSDNLDISLIDRTPLMSWAYSVSTGKENPHLSKILEEGLLLTKELSIDLMFLFDIDPITMYSRIICRNCDKTQPIEEQVMDLSKSIIAPNEIINQIIELSMSRLKSEEVINRKRFQIWDYMPYDEVCRQVENYRKLVEIAKERIGLEGVIINSRKKIGEVVKEVQNHIK